jgi:hypothetical protein
MEPSSPKFRLTSKEKVEEQNQTEQRPAGKEFASVEEMLRYDAAQVSPPASLSERLQESIAREPAAKIPWWRRWFSR